MLRFIRFCLACVREAAHGTIERANAWFWPIGIPIIAFISWYWELGRLTIPNTPQGFIIFMVVTVAASWVVFFIIRLIGAPARLYARLEEEKAETEARLARQEQTRATLAIDGPHIFKDSRYINQVHWRMRVYNIGPAAAANVQMKLRRGKSEPRDSNWGADYPYPVFRAGAIINAPEHVNAAGHQINPNDDEYYEIICGWKSEGGPFFTTLNTKGGGHNKILIEPDERWTLLYEVTASNAATINFTLKIFVDADQVKVVRTN